MRTLVVNFLSSSSLYCLCLQIRYTWFAFAQISTFLLNGLRLTRAEHRVMYVHDSSGTYTDCGASRQPIYCQRTGRCFLALFWNYLTFVVPQSLATLFAE
jgi:hypothetical protein